MNKIISIILTTSFIPVIGHATKTEDLLKSASADTSMRLYEAYESDLYSSQSYLRGAQLFYSRESDFTRNNRLKHELGIKLEPKSWAEIRGGKNQSVQSAEELKKLQLSRVLADRYKLIINYVAVGRKVELLTKVSEIAKKNFKTQLLASQIGKSDAKKIVKARLDWSRMQRDLKEAQILKADLEHKLKTMAPDFNGLNFAETWLVPEKVNERLAKIKPAIKPLSVRAQEIEYQDLMLEHTIYKGRQYSLINSLELSTTRTENDSNDSSMQFKISFNLPFLMGDEATSIKHRDFVKKRISIQQDMAILDSEYKATFERTKSLIDSYVQLKQFFGQQALFENSVSIDPQISIETLFEALAARNEFQDLETEILISYIQLLHESGVMSEKPEINYLSEKESRI